MASELGRIPVAQLIEDGDLVINDGYRAKNSELSISGLPFARAQNIKEGFHFDDADRFPEDDLHKVGIKISQPGDVVFTSKGTVGRFALVRPDTPRFVYAPQLCFWRSTNPNRLDPLYLYYWMNSREFFVQFKGVSGQTDMAEYVSLRDQRAMHITLPEISVQRRIASILGALDDKIELNRRMNRTLEKMAAAVFKSWFIDFDPVRAKAENRDPGLPAEIADLFSDAFQDSSLGPIPEGWDVVNLPQAIAVNPQRQLRKGTRAVYVEMSNMPTRSSRVLGWETRPFTSGSKFQNGDVLVARITPCLENGKTAYVDFLDGPTTVGWGSTEYIVLRSKPPLPTVYAYCLARSERFRTHAVANMSGTSGRQRVPPSCLDAFPIVLPSDSVAEAFGRYADEWMHRIRKNDEQAQTLAGLRDALRPKLLSGEIDVSEKTFVELAR